MRWVELGDGVGVSWRGFDDGGFLVATVVRYDAPVPHWAAFVRQEPLEGQHETAEEAMAAAEAHHDAAPKSKHP